MKENLIRILDDSFMKQYEKRGLLTAPHTADDLIANGVTVLPCKIGDEFWTEWVGIRKVRCSMLTQKADGSWKGRFTVEKSGGCGIDVSFGKSGKKLFLTKEEAESHFAQPPKGE